jgi:Flp pilus assembly secretin CpaC
MRMLKKYLCWGACVLAMASANVLPSQAAEAITVETDQTLMVSIPSVPGAVVIGNPVIADVSMQGTKMFILGRNFGTTNIYILDIDGNPMATFDVSVKHTTDNTVAMFKGPARQSYNCAPYCESELQVGDEVVYSKIINDQMKSKMELATGQDSAKSEAPPAPQ